MATHRYHNMIQKANQSSCIGSTTMMINDDKYSKKDLEITKRPEF